MLLRTLLHSCKIQLFCFQPTPHSLRKTRLWGEVRVTKQGIGNWRQTGSLPHSEKPFDSHSDSVAWRCLSLLSVPKILPHFIPEILSHPAIAGRDETLSVPPVGKPVGRREEDVGNVKASRSRDSAEGWSRPDRSGPFGGSVAMLSGAHCGRSASGSCR